MVNSNEVKEVLPFIDIVDMPADPNGSLSDLRKAVIKSHNTARHREDSLAAYREQLEYALSRITPKKAKTKKAKV